MESDMCQILGFVMREEQLSQLFLVPEHWLPLPVFFFLLFLHILKQAPVLIFSLSAEANLQPKIITSS